MRCSKDRPVICLQEVGVKWARRFREEFFSDVNYVTHFAPGRLEHLDCMGITTSYPREKWEEICARKEHPLGGLGLTLARCGLA